MRIDIDKYEKKGCENFDINDAPTKIKDLYDDDDHYEILLDEIHQELDALQSMMYAHNRYGMLVIFQAMDAAGKDSTIKHVFTGVNPFGIKTFSFKRPSETELNHDFLWRSNLLLPERGSISIFNRSYYEEVLVVKVHPEILTKGQKVPISEIDDLDKVWKQRYEDIVNLEKYLERNGIVVVKFFLNVSKEEQGQRLIARIQDPTKNWKFEEGDLKERALWQVYQKAYEDCINATATKKAPWYVIPADDKKNMRLMVAQILVEQLKKLDIHYPANDAAYQKKLMQLIEVIEQQNKEE
jgi:PPK2 family polyphosphate:nucleotide phosphotransferase